MKKENLEEKIAYRESIVTDQGTGGSYCSNCKYDLTRYPLEEDIKDFLKRTEYCPGCKYKLKEGGMYVQSGGSDF